MRGAPPIPVVVATQPGFATTVATHRILAGDERPGGTVIEVAVAEFFGVGRPSANAAVDRLVTEGSWSATAVAAASFRRSAPTTTPIPTRAGYCWRGPSMRLGGRRTSQAVAHLANASLRHAAVSDARRLV